MRDDLNTEQFEKELAAIDPIRRSQELMRSELPRRFYSDVSFVPADDGHFSIQLDGRGVKTPAGQALKLPNTVLAELICQEWKDQVDVIDPASMPLTRLANTTLDGISDNAAAVLGEIVSYCGNDLLFYRASSPAELVQRQQDRWDPLLGWMARDFSATFKVTKSVMFVQQPAESIDIFKRELQRHEDPFALAALHVMTTLTGSAILALAVAREQISLEQAWELAHLEEDWTIEHWGHDAEADQRRELRYTDMVAAHTVLKAMQP
ncbi:ATP12 family protein [Martelella sp. HB161492]|uniref:ATP12 family chaperone protein n=1 Tax=Martelella sp. HB161492 TaxID=2720726 RepID=UPI0015919E68|nr:ATP12 family protein [Martelella sp. HB161492]